MFRSGDRVGVAVSGGPDSVALLLALVELAPELGMVLAVVHLNHKLRGADSDADAEFVRALAASLQLDCVLETADVAATADNLEQAARRARYEFFHRLIAGNRVQKIATGHTRTDQAETVLFRLLRGSTTAGLAGIYPVLDSGVVRPLIDLERSDVLDYLRSRGQPWRQDASNQDPALARTRLRHELLPQLARDWNPSITASLGWLADWSRDEEAYWRGEIDRLVPDYLRERGGCVFLEASRVAALPAAAERRLLRRAVELARGDLRGVESTHIEQIRTLTAAEEGHGRTQLPGLDVFRSFDQVRLAPAGRDSGLETRNFTLPLAVPGAYHVEQTQTRFILKLMGSEDRPPQYNDGGGGLDWDRTPQPLVLRNWRPGDRYHPVGFRAQEKLKDLFQRRRVPLWERRSWPVIASGETLVWSRVFGAASELAASPGARTVLEITEVEDATGVPITSKGVGDR